jgi:hypothetical protein
VYGFLKTTFHLPFDIFIRFLDSALGCLLSGNGGFPRGQLGAGRPVRLESVMEVYCLRPRYEITEMYANLSWLPKLVW